VLDEQAVAHERAIEAPVLEGLPVNGTAGLDLAIQDAVTPKDVAARIAERSGLDRRPSP
jgi:hypothetical protein